MKIYPETVALAKDVSAALAVAVLLLVAAVAAFWLTNSMINGGVRNPRDPLSSVVASKSAPTNNTPVVNRTNEPAPWLSDPVLQQRAALSLGVTFGYEAARRGAGPADILKLKDAFESHQLAIVEDWFTTHSKPTR